MALGSAAFSRWLLVGVAIAALAAAACGDGDADPGSSDAPPPPPPSNEPAASAPPDTDEERAESRSAPDSQDAGADPAPSLPPPPEPPPPEPAPPTPQPYDNARTLGIVRHLAGTIGPRVQGAPADREAADFLAQRFAAAGYQVDRQRFPLATFQEGPLTVEADGGPIPATLFGGSVGGTVTGPLVAVPGLGEAKDYEGRDVAGAVVLVQRGILLFQDKVDTATEHGAAAILIFNNEPGAFQGTLREGSRIPAISLARTQGVALRDALETDLVEIAIVAEGGLMVVESENVIARSQSGECSVYVGGHYDTVPGVPGANDNASGTAIVVELARAFAGSEGVEHVCFVAFGAEEASQAGGGLNGSRFLIERLEAEGALAQLTAMLNLDAVGDGRLVLVGDGELVGIALRLAAALEIPAARGALPEGAGSDHLLFEASGVPVIFPTAVGAQLHTPADNLDNLDPQVLDDVGRLAHALLRCLIQRAAGAPVGATDVCLSPAT